MSKRELGRVEVLARVRSKQLRVLDAGRLLRVSYRQAKRLWKRYREEGAAGLKHSSAGESSNRAHDQKCRQQVLRRVRKEYGGAVGERFGPTLAAEHLASEDGLKIPAETLRRWMLTEGLWSRERKRRRHLLRRERQEHFGEMVQMDGSFHAWLEERGPQGCLIDLVDDATSTTWAQLGEQETIWAVADALRAWMERYGGAAVGVRGLEECVQTCGHGEGAVARRRAGHAVWAHVREAGDRGDRGQFAAREGTSRAAARHASGPAGEKAKAEGNRQSRSSERVFGEGLSAGA